MLAWLDPPVGGSGPVLTWVSCKNFVRYILAWRSRVCLWPSREIRSTTPPPSLQVRVAR